MDARIAKAVEKAIEDRMFTIAKLNDAMYKMRRIMPKPALFLSTKQYPGTDALKIETSGEDFVVANPMFWERATYELSRDHIARPSDSMNPLFASPLYGIRIEEIDGPFEDSAAGDVRRRYVEGIWERLIEAIKVACVELPDWLKAPPKFTVHK